MNATAPTNTPATSTAPAAPAPAPLRIVHNAHEWYNRLPDRRMALQAAIDFAKDLASASKARDLSLDDFIAIFHQGKVMLENRRDELGMRFRWALNHWSFGQICTLVGAPAAYLRRLPGHLAVECLNVSLRERNKALSVYRTTRDVEGLKTETVRAVTSRRYKRFFDHKVLTWVKDTGLPTSDVWINDRAMEVEIQGQHVRAPDYGHARLSLIVGNSEVGASSVSTNAAIRRDGWRIPITVAGARVRHTGDVDKKTYEKLNAAKEVFTTVQGLDLERKLNAAYQDETKTRGEWYAWLKARKVGKNLAKKILPEGSDEAVTTSRWKLAVSLANRAANIPYFDERTEAELVASKVLGI